MADDGPQVLVLGDPGDVVVDLPLPPAADGESCDGIRQIAMGCSVGEVTRVADRIRIRLLACFRYTLASGTSIEVNEALALVFRRTAAGWVCAGARFVPGDPPRPPAASGEAPPGPSARTLRLITYWGSKRRRYLLWDGYLT